jgi:hypothetical protein
MSTTHFMARIPVKVVLLACPFGQKIRRNMRANQTVEFAPQVM